jgi:hypothetical protein
MCNHRGNYKAWYKDNTYGYISSFEILKYDDAYIELLEEFPCENSAQLHKKEGEHIRLHRDMCVNVQVAGRSKNEYAEEHKKKTDAYQEAYREVHKEQHCAYDKAYHEDHKEKRNAKSKAYREAHTEETKAYQKIYREAHKEETKAYKKAYYQANKAKKALATDP